MAKMFEIKGKTATQNAFLAFAAYNRAITLADEQKVKIDFIDGKKIVATAKSNKAIVAYVDAFESEYAKAHAEYAKAHAKAPKRTKGNGIDLSKIKGETNKDKNKALHALLVSKGIKDSRSPEYMSVWNARPWAK